MSYQYDPGQAPTATFPAVPGPAQPEQEQITDNSQPDGTPRYTSNGFTAEERSQRGRPVLGNAETVSPDDRSAWPRALTDGLATWSLIASLFGFSVIGIILGSIHVSNAHKLRQRASGVGAWGLGLGIAGLVAEVLLIIVIIAAMASVSSAGYSG